jgi:GT2 family glycosyltransferase/glycosyltransferase involved in cell wall biosynthesis
MRSDKADSSVAIIKEETGLTKNKDENPKISIIIPVYNQLKFTKQCIEAVWATCTHQDYEIIVIDDCSTDETPEYLESIKLNVRSYRNQKNQGFLLNINFGASQAKGEYIVLLNNDTIPQEGWLEGLLEPFELYEKVAATGALMIFPNNTILEACSIVFSDGSGWNYGRGDNPDASRYNFIRETDYVSGGGMMVSKKIWEELGGLDTNYCPAYYDDIDFCFRARKAGYKILYTPFSRIIHFEGMTGGTDVTQGPKRYQMVNQQKFYERWKDELKNHYENKYENVFRASRREKGKRILMFDHILPLPNFNSGCLRMNNIVKSLVNQGHKITFVSLSNADPDNYKDFLRKMGVETVYLNFEAWEFSDKKNSIIDQILRMLEIYNNNYDIVYFAFYWVANLFMRNVKRRLPNAIVYVDSVDIHFLRKQREAELHNDKKYLLAAEKTKIEELLVYARADAVITVTEEDKKVLNKELPGKPVFIIPNVHDIIPTNVGFGERRDLLFVGGFNHLPNVDAMLYFCKEIFPKVKEKIPDIKLWIVGSNPTEEVKALANGSVIVTGWIDDTKPYLDKCRISIAPLRYGAGMKGKVGEAMSQGLPVITTQVGSEGFGIINSEHAIEVDKTNEWVEKTVNLYNDEKLWKKLSSNGQALMAGKYGSERMISFTQKILEIKSKDEIAAMSKYSYKNMIVFNDVRITIIIITYNQWEYTKKCVDSIKKFTKIPYKILIVDNGSTDETKEYLKKLKDVDVILNKENKGFPIACNQAISKTSDDYVLILNNDVVVTQGWLERLVEIAELNPSVGLIGPVSNKVSGLQADEDAKYDSIEKMHLYARKNLEKNYNQRLFFPRIAFLCTLIRRDVIDRIGGLDERFSPGNYEDDDFCLRAQLAGYKTLIAKDVFIHHYGSKSFKAEGIEKYNEYLERNRKIFVDKWGATPDEIWLKNKSIKNRQYFYPISFDETKQHFERARTNIKDNELNSAYLELNKVMELLNGKDKNASDYTYSDIVNLAGNVSLALGNVDTAQKHFEEEISISAASFVGLGEVFVHKGLFKNAKTLFELALYFNKENQLANDHLEKVNNMLGLTSNNNEYMNCMKIDENPFGYLIHEAFESYEKQEYQKGLELILEYEKNYKIKSDNEMDNNDFEKFYNLKGFFHLRLNELANARTCFEQALKVNPQSSQACSGLGEYFYLSLNIDAAKTMFDWAVKNDANNQTAINWLKKINRKLGLQENHNSLLNYTQLDILEEK